MRECRARVQACKALGLSERWAGTLVPMARSSVRDRRQPPAPDEEALQADVLRLADAIGAMATDAAPPCGDARDARCMRSASTE